jgi:hypothetical protein
VNMCTPTIMGGRSGIVQIASVRLSSEVFMALTNSAIEDSTQQLEFDSSAVINDTDILEEADYKTLDDPQTESEPVGYSGTDFDVEGLVRRVQRKDIVVPTFGHGDSTVETAGFQRNFVWRKPQMDRFIESLLLGYPVPGIVLVQQRDKRYLVLDGQQRLQTLAHFYEGIYAGREFALESVSKDFVGLTYKKLDDTLRRTLDNSFIQAIVVRTDGSAASLESIYQIFERLNSGGTQLTAHEIRVALYAGPLIDFVAGLNRTNAWRQLYGTFSPRLRDQELILRIIALFVTPGTYRRPLKQYLNSFAGAHRDCASLPIHELSQLFEDACNCLHTDVGNSAFRHTSGQVNVALTEAVVVGMMRRLEAGPRPDAMSVKTAIEALKHDPEFVLAITRATADEENVRTRLARSTQAIAQK